MNTDIVREQWAEANHLWRLHIRGDGEIPAAWNHDYDFAGKRIDRRGRNISYYFAVRCAGSNTYFVNSQGDSPYVRPESLLRSRREGVNYPLDDYTYETLLTPIVRPRRRRAVSVRRHDQAVVAFSPPSAPA